MAKVVYLKTGERPPESEDWVLITATPSGKHDITTSIARPLSATFHYDTAIEGELGPIISRAVAQADSHGIGRVYVEGAVRA